LRRLDFVIRAGSFNFSIGDISKIFLHHQDQQILRLLQQPDRFNRSGRDPIWSSSTRSSSTNSTAGAAEFVAALHEWTESFVAFGRCEIACGRRLRNPSRRKSQSVTEQAEYHWQGLKTSSSILQNLIG
jgi:hypothetical protein